MQKNNENSNGSFWIVYADLMAGLLFVFILLLSAIILKYIFTQDALMSEKASLDKSKALILNKEQLLEKLQNELKKANNSLLLEQDKNIQINDYVKDLTLSIDEVNEKNQELLKDVDEKDAQILALLAQLEENNKDINTKDEQLEEISKKLQSFKIEYDKLKNNKSKLITALQDKLSKQILVDINSGSISLNASVLFDSDEFSIKEDAKKELKETLSKYFTAILNSPEILANIEAIIIEGHTDSSGSYIYNLELSQKRALEIMKFIHSFNKNAKLEKLLQAVGKSYNEPIIKDGKEDKQASRRIEIKLLFTNKAATSNFEKAIGE
ncbi:OmpA family protein [Campylobacter canadensis]|uniref:OmpA family protein n=1 Tax=Campylobacter canadensis TaxID=449520 RepID=UPI001557F6A2|nr:OmpA family protein [Campylobacter canadensis]MBZ7995265.1 OmpA family protein [Campylobacter canadensis]MBZ7996770.1 OmpA family protein [Campylobacter canadensis]MBZ8000649.1 OmpA family protein [Campylobacter canadensis]MBZ8001996.1 OmpA family protein [Campylobacter canadensis]MBZ8004549.1 OmpA family protein [Campylobacter canadensis]